MIGLFAMPAMMAGAAAGAPPVVVVAKPVCRQWDKPGTDCAMPPFRWEIDIYRDGGRGWRQPPDPTLMRGVWLMRGDGVPASAVPVVLKGGAEPRTVNARLRLTVGPAGTASSCAPRPFGEEKPRATDTADPAVLAQACRIVGAHGKFRHALGADGQPIARDVDVTVSFRWDRFDIPSAPMPPPPAGFVSSNSNDWPPASLPYGRIVIVEGDWAAHLTDRKKLPKEAVTGLTITVGPDGRATNCTIRASSGDPRLDAASCNALAARDHGSTARWNVERYPVKVRWRKDKAKLELPVGGKAPDLPIAGAIPIDFAMPSGQPEYRRVRVVLGVTADGAISGCEVRSTSMDDGWDAASCAAARRFAKVTPGSDVFGGPADGGLNLMIDWDKRSILRDGY